MGTSLRKVAALINIPMILLLPVLDVDDASAQVTLENLHPFSIEISDQSDLSNSSYWHLAPEDVEISNLFGITNLEAQEREEYFLLEQSEGTYLALRPETGSANQLLKFRLVNNSESTIDRIQLSLDIAVQVSGSRESELSLSYRTGTDSENRTLLNLNQFDVDPARWQITGLNTLVENLFLEQGESIEITVDFASEGEGTPDAVALNRLQLSPEEFRGNTPLKAGEIMITEIFPGATVDGENLYYLEFYNPSFRTIDLRGMRIRTGNDDYTIRESLKIEPYQMAVVANRRTEELQPDQILDRLSMPSYGGMVELFQEGDRIARAAYDEQTGNRSWELERASHMMDGYATMNNYQPSEEFLSANLYGSPGTTGSTIRVFTADADSEAEWALLSFPGTFTDEVSGNHLYRTMRSEATEQILPRGAGLLKKMSDSDQDKWIVEETDTGGHVEVDLAGRENDWVLIGNPFEIPISMSHITAVDGEFQSETAQVWNGRRGVFEVLRPDSMIAPWQAVVLRNRDAESVLISREPEYSRNEQSPERMIRFTLQLDGRNDQETVLYFHEESLHGQDKLDAEKLWPVFDASDVGQKSLLYFIGQGENDRLFLAQDARPYEPESSFEVALGHLSLNASREQTLIWDEFSNIPDDWEVTIRDLETGISADLREESHITFRSAVHSGQGPDYSDGTVLQSMTLREPHERFILSVNPNPQLAGSTAEESSSGPDKIELYQNYPNPFSSVTNIDFFLPEQRPVILSVYNIVGQRVALLLNGDPIEGRADELVWDASEMPSGLYILRLEAGNDVLTRKMTLIK